MTKVFHIMEPPPPDFIPVATLQLYETLSQMPTDVTEEFLDTIVAAFEALVTTYKNWMRPHLADFEPHEILEYGPKLDSLDRLSTELADALIKHQNGAQFMKTAWQMITVMQELWSIMDQKGRT